MDLTKIRRRLIAATVDHAQQHGFGFVGTVKCHARLHDMALGAMAFARLAVKGESANFEKILGALEGNASDTVIRKSNG